MTPQEEQMLGDLVRRVQTTNLSEKDPDAQKLLQEQLAGHPDSLYILAQTVLVQNYALEQAKRQMDQLKQQAQPASAPAPAKATSFLGSIFGHSQSQQPAQSNYAPVQQQQPGYSQAPPASQPPASQWSTPQGGGPAYAGQGGYAPPPQTGGGSSFLRSAATTAAGVAAGALAFEGVESLMHGFGREAGFGGGGGFGGGMMGGGMPVEETVVNNYYDSPGEDREGDRFDNASDRFDDRQSQLDDVRDDGQQDVDDLQPQLDDASDVNVSDDGGSFDDASLDDGGDFGGDDSSLV